MPARHGKINPHIVRGAKVGYSNLAADSTRRASRVSGGMDGGFDALPISDSGGNDSKAAVKADGGRQQAWYQRRLQCRLEYAGQRRNAASRVCAVSLLPTHAAVYVGCPFGEPKALIDPCRFDLRPDRR